MNISKVVQTARTLLLAGALVLAGFAHAAAQQGQPPAQQVPAADAADVESIDAILGALYGAISGPAGEARDWDRLRSLFHPGAKMVPTGQTPTGQFAARLMTVDDYVNGSAQMIEQIGFREVEVARHVDRYDNIAQVFSTYAGYREGVEEPFLRGINSLQLFNDGTRWWIMSLLWEAERPDNPLPERYLSGDATGAQ